MTPKHFIIAGGGTAGWMAALLLAHTWRDHPFTFTLLESDQIPTVGVGEGSTPGLKKFFDYLGIAEHEWMPACHATYKTGIEFRHWSGRKGYPRYFHAFDSQLDLHTEPAFFYNCDMKRQGVAIDAAPEHYFINAHLARTERLPTSTPYFPFVVGYGYHFDASRLAAFMRAHGARLGIAHRVVTIDEVERNAVGDIVSLGCSGERLTGDFFIDCTGFASVLIEKSLAEPFVSYADCLLNDRALTLSGDVQQFRPQTTATALSAGWLWQIPLTHRLGQGYVYSSAHISDDQAEAELRTQVGLLKADVCVKKLHMRVGRRRNHWVNNCLAVGLSQGFVEPLEATALNLVQTTLQQFIDAYELGGFSRMNCEKFNRRINDHFDGVRDYIVAHYVCSDRDDTAYWRDARHVPCSDPLKQLLSAWRGVDKVAGVDKVDRVIEEFQLDRFYTKMSWYSLFSGYGVYLPQEQLRQGTAKAHRYSVEQVKDFLTACAENYTKILG